MPKPQLPLELSEGELAAGLVLLDPLLFRVTIFADELSEEMSLEQKLMVCDESEQVLLCTGRKVAKTVHLEAFILQQGIITWGEGIQEALCFAPAEKHLLQIMGRVYKRINRSKLLQLFVAEKTEGDKASLTFAGGLMWWFRIEGLSGKDTNMVGIRAKFIVGDELAFGNWVCHNSRIQTALPGCKWIYAGVPNGVRGTPFHFLDTALEANGWSRHKFDTFANPLYKDPKRRLKLIEQYGGESTQGYLNNVLGLWGEELVSIFPPGSLAMHDRPYKILELSAFANDQDLDINLPTRLPIPPMPCDGFALGMDYGLSIDPTVILGASLTLLPRVDLDRGDPNKPPPPPDELWQIRFRLMLYRVSLPHQIKILRWLMANVFLGPFLGFSTDKPEVVQLLQAADAENASLFYQSNPGGTIAVPLQVTETSPDGRQVVEIKEVMIGLKEHYTDNLTEWMMNSQMGLHGLQLQLGKEDLEQHEELSGTTARKTESGRTIYQPPLNQAGQPGNNDHITDATRYLTDPIERQRKLHQVSKHKKSLFASMGFVVTGEREGGGGLPWSKPKSDIDIGGR